MFVAFVLGYSTLRYAIELVRADADRGGWGPLSTSQLIAAVTFLAASALSIALVRRRRRAGPVTGEVREPELAVQERRILTCANR
jgi:prolipoprotein diacylglyceryltransferase